MISMYAVRDKVTGRFCTRKYDMATVELSYAGLWQHRGWAEKKLKRCIDYYTRRSVHPCPDLEVVEFLLLQRNCPDCRGEKLLAKLKEWGID